MIDDTTLECEHIKLCIIHVYTWIIYKTQYDHVSSYVQEQFKAP